MAHAFFGFPRWTPAATFTGPVAVAGYPVAQLGTLPLARVYRTEAIDDIVTIEVTLDKLRRIGVVTLCRHNCRPGAKLRIRLYDEDGGDLLWESGWQDVWPVLFTEDQVDWDGGRWWDRTYTEEEIQGYPWNRAVYVAEPLYAGFLTAEIDDADNPDEFFQAAYLDIADAFPLPMNFPWNTEYGFQRRTESQEAIGGTEYFERRGKPRIFNATIPYFPRGDAMGRFFEMKRQLDVDQPVFFSPNPDDRLNALRTDALYRFTDLDLQTYASAGGPGGRGFDRVPFRMKEAL